ncbi:hypothetical protein [Glutamicibacter sp. TV12E]|uniref:hypothetical protein n=1 Tax=Glutamicibacter sp. TV12E TaxID=3446362 RepID=UPI0040333C2B
MTWIWLLVASVCQACEVTVDSTADAQVLRNESEESSSAQLAEVISACAAPLEEYAPDTDVSILAVTRRDGRKVPVDGLSQAGLLVVESTGELGFTIGRGMVIVMLDGELVLITRPDPAAYVEAYQLPGFKYWKA